jgi:hypothetical protein
LNPEITETSNEILQYSLNQGSTSRAYLDGEYSLNETIQIYREWVTLPSYAIFYKPDYTKPAPAPFMRLMSHSNHYCKYFAMKLSKRGNDVYRWRVKTRLKPLINLCQTSKNEKFIETNRRNTTSNLFIVTLTYDTKLKKFNKAWLNITKELNKFLSNIKKKYGKIQVIRTIESFKNGSNYPHIHLILRLTQKLPVFRYTDKKGKLHFLLTNSHLNQIRKYWHSYIKIEAVKNMGAIGYILKYITKEMYTKDKYTTISLLWLFRKQSYSITHNFTEKLSADLDSQPVHISLLDTYMHNSNLNLDNIKFLCVVNLKLAPENWYLEIEPPPFENYDLKSDNLPTYPEMFLNFNPKSVEEVK